jgi:hypothetical protein
MHRFHFAEQATEAAPRDFTASEVEVGDNDGSAIELKGCKHPSEL